MKQNKAEQLKAENARLKLENAQLKKRAAKKGPAKPASRHGLLRNISVTILVFIAVTALAAGNLFLWFGNTVVKPDRFAAATAPIIKDPKVQKAAALYTTNSIYNNIDVQQITENALPPRADFLAAPLAGQLKTFTQASLQKALATPKLQDKWNTVLAKQHQRLIGFASRYQGDGDISLNDVFTQLTRSLAGTKLAFLAGKQLPAKAGDITLVSAPWLPAFHKLVVNIDTWRLLLIILLVISLALAAWLSLHRRRTIYIFCLASAALVLLTIIGLYLLRMTIADKADPQYSAGVGQAIAILTNSLVTQSVTLLAALGVVALVAWISSTAHSALTVKTQITPIFSTSIHRRIFSQDNSFTGWFQKNKHLLEWSVVAIFTVVMLAVRLTIAGLLIYGLSILALVLAIEAVSGQADASSDGTRVSGVTAPGRSLMVK